MLDTDDLRYHTEIGTGYSKDAQLCRAADEIDRLREALKLSTAGLCFEAKRLRRVAMLMGIAVPESDEALMIAAGGVLGEVERAIERAFETPNC